MGEIKSGASVLSGNADPRKARGIRHSAFGLLTGVMLAVLAGGWTTVEIAERARDLSAGQREQVGLTWATAPSLSTIRRFLLVLEQVVLQEPSTCGRSRMRHKIRTEGR